MVEGFSYACLIKSIFRCLAVEIQIIFDGLHDGLHLCINWRVNDVVLISPDVIIGAADVEGGCRCHGMEIRGSGGGDR